MTTPATTTLQIGTLVTRLAGGGIDGKHGIGRIGTVTTVAERIEVRWTHEADGTRLPKPIHTWCATDTVRPAPAENPEGHATFPDGTELVEGTAVLVDGKHLGVIDQGGRYIPGHPGLYFVVDVDGEAWEVDRARLTVAQERPVLRITRAEHDRVLAANQPLLAKSFRVTARYTWSLGGVTFTGLPEVVAAEIDRILAPSQVASCPHCGSVHIPHCQTPHWSMFREEAIGGVVDSAGNVTSDADPGL